MEDMKFRHNSRELQEYLFSLGYEWAVGKKKGVRYLDKPCLYLDSASGDYAITYGERERDFDRINNKEMTLKKLKEEMGMKNYIMIDGKKIELSEESAKSIAEGLKVKDEAWVPKKGDTYYCIDEALKIDRYLWCGDSTDIASLKSGNCYKTREITGKKLADMNDEINKKLAKVEKYVRNHDDEGEADWDNTDKLKYFISYSYYDNEWNVDCSYGYKTTSFAMSEDMCKKVVDMLNDGRL